MITFSGKIPIHIHPFFFVIVALIGWMNSYTVFGVAIWAIVIVISLLVHEFGHALTALFFGQQAEISLAGLGGMTSRSGEKLAQWQEFFVVLNGPLAGFFLYFLLVQISPLALNAPLSLQNLIVVGKEVNLFWTLFNLLPVLPLDGGHLFRLLLESFFGFRGTKVALLVSFLFAAVLGLGLMVIQQIFMGAIFFMFAFESYPEWSEMRLIKTEDKNPKVVTLYQEALQEAKQGQEAAAILNFKKVRDQAKEGIVFTLATQELARLYSKQGDYRQAYELLAPIRNRLSVDYLVLLQNLAYRIEQWEHCAQIGTLAYQKKPSKEVALLNAMTFAIMGQTKECVGWLRCAFQMGAANLPELIRKREFDAVRQEPLFQSWEKSLFKN